MSKQETKVVITEGYKCDVCSKVYKYRQRPDASDDSYYTPLVAAVAQSITAARAGTDEAADWDVCLDCRVTLNEWMGKGIRQCRANREARDAKS